MLRERCPHGVLDLRRGEDDDFRRLAAGHLHETIEDLVWQCSATADEKGALQPRNGLDGLRVVLRAQADVQREDDEEGSDASATSWSQGSSPVGGRWGDHSTKGGESTLSELAGRVPCL